jgi:cytochrome c biogenesis protein CcmG/thiol:disulfide interchange protein DsbE
MNKPVERQSKIEVNQKKDEITSEENDSHSPKNRKSGFFIAVIIIVVLLGFIGWVFINDQSNSVEEGLAPDFKITSFEGETLTLSDLRGQVVVINFWASWCIPCRDETPYLERIWRIYQDKDVIFIGVDIQDTIKEALGFIDEYDVTYFTGPDFGSEIAKAFNLRGLPQTFFIAKNGEINSVIVGELIPPELEEKLDELLAEPYP